MVSPTRDLIDTLRSGDKVTIDMLARADAELVEVARQRAAFVERIRVLEQRDQDTERFCKELVIKCGDALSLAAKAKAPAPRPTSNPPAAGEVTE